MPRTRDINPHNRNGHRRRQLVARIKATSTHCALCGQPLNPDAPHQDPTETVIDEDIPRSRGGNPLDPDNTNALHRWCNSWKATMTLKEARQLLAAGHTLTTHPTKQTKLQALAKPVGNWSKNADQS